MTPERIKRAAEVLRGEALCLRKSHTVSGFDWDDSTPEDVHARECHDEMLALAIELEALATERKP